MSGAIEQPDSATPTVKPAPAIPRFLMNCLLVGLYRVDIDDSFVVILVFPVRKTVQLTRQAMMAVRFVCVALCGAFT